MKDNSSNIQKSESDQKIHEKIKSIDSPKITKNNFFDDFLLSPDKKPMNQKFFPSKENYFGVKTSPYCTQRCISPKSHHSPILNYYAGLSPESHDFTYYSPKNESLSKLKSNNSMKVSPNFNTSPSAIFNATGGSTKNLKTIQEEDSKTLQEKIAPYVGVENIIKNGNDEEDDDDDEDGQGVFVLSFREDGQDLDPNKPIHNYTEENEENIKVIKNKENLNLNNNKDIEENKVKNIIDKSEFKPYIPNILRNQQNYINFYDEGNYPYNNNFNFPNNNYMNMNINLPPNFNNMNNINNNNMINPIPTNIINNINYIDDANIENNENKTQSHSFFYNGDNYQLNDLNDYKKPDYKKTGEIPSITQADVVTTITANNKVIKRINPNVYLNESLEFLAFNILPLAQDQAGCRYLQEIVEKDPINATKYFYKAMIPYLVTLIKDPFGNYLVQKLFPYLTGEEIKILLDNIAPNVSDLGSNHHGTRVIQNIIHYLKTPESVQTFLNMIKPFIIPLLKEMHGAHIINKFISIHPEYSSDINKLIIDNCSSLATHKHGCCFLQKILESPDSPMKNQLIRNLIDNFFVLIIDQFGNYVIQSILFLNNNKYSSEIALRISESAPYYSKHRYSSNVIEKCFDFCGKRERNILIEKICTPEIITDLILDEHGNYVMQKALYYADYEVKEEILKIVKPLIPKIRNTSFGDKLLNRLFSMYPKLNNRNLNDDRKGNRYQYGNLNNNYMNNGNYRNKKYNNNYGFMKNNNFNNDGYMNMNRFNNINNFNNVNNYNNFENNTNDGNNSINSINSINSNSNINNNINNKFEMNSKNDINTDNLDLNNNNNVSLNNIYNINNNTINININSNQEENGENKINLKNPNNNIVNEDKNINEDESNYNNNPNEHKKKKKKKKGKKVRKSSDKLNSENVNNSNNNENID